MKKKSVLALLLACSFAFGTASMTACNIFGGDGGNGTGTEQGDPTVAVTGVSLNKDVLNLKIGGSETLTATVAPANAKNRNVTWKSDKPDIASVDENGKVTAKAKGTAIITVTTVSGGKTDTCTVNVSENTPAPVKVESVSLSPTSKALKVGEHITLTPSFTPANPDNTNVSWSASNDAVSVVNGVVTANKVGNAIVTVTTADGGKTATCEITVEAATPAAVNVSGVSVNPSSATIKVGETKQLTKTITPANANNQAVTWSSDNETAATVDTNGLVTAKAAGRAIITVRTADGGYTATCAVTVKAEATEPIVTGNFSYKYSGNECAAFEWADTNAAGATVEYKLSADSNYTALSGDDKEYLVRQVNASTARVDFVGLKGGAVYDFKITPAGGTAMTVTNMTINAYDRSGYAHFKKTDGVGAYKDDGTPKSGANIVYVNEENKNDVDGKGTSVAELLTSQGGRTPLIVRIVGTVGAATWKQGLIDYGEGKTTPKSSVLCKDGKTTLADFVEAHKNEKDENGNSISALSQEVLAKYGANDLDTSTYAVLDGLSSAIKDSTKEYDSCWNDCSISGAKNVTVEGIGEDARIFQWGMTFRNSNSIEIRNLTFEDYTEDACSFEGGSSSTSSTSADGFTYKNFWVHHNTFEKGVNYWDVCSEQDKHDGDGSTDVKRVSYVTFSYNVYNETHKTGLVGSDDSVNTAAVTFHHNYYNGCKARLPLARKANMHMYNNYYYNTTGTSLSLRGDAYAFVENCYFNHKGSAVDIELQHNATDGDGSVKVYNSIFDSKNITLKTGVVSNHKLEATSRTATVTTTNKFGGGNGANFDLSTTLFYYDGTKSDVEIMFTAAETKQYVPDLAGVQKRDGDVTLGGSGSGGGSTGGNQGGTEKPDPDPGSNTDVYVTVDDAVKSGKLTVNTSKSNFEADLGNGVKAVMKTGTVEALSATIGGVSFTNCVRPGGNSKSGNKRHIEVTVTGACTISVYVANSNGKGNSRRIGLYSSAESYADTELASGTQAVTLDDGTSQVVTFTVSTKGTYYIAFPDNVLNVYAVAVKYQK